MSVQKFLQLWITKCKEIIKRAKSVFNEIETSPSAKPVLPPEQPSRLNQIREPSIDLTNAKAALDDVKAIPDDVKIALDEIKKGESQTCEFKRTFALDVKSKKKSSKVITKSVKTVAGFMNQDGGDLYIGVADDGGIVGIGDEVDKTKLPKSLDEYKLKITEILKKKIGPANTANTNLFHLEIKDELIVRIKCCKSKRPVRVKGNQEGLYVRLGASTDNLKESELEYFLKDRFEN